METSMSKLKAFLASSLLLTAAPAGADELHLYSWSDYFGASLISTFTKESGTKVVYDVFDSNDIVETKLLTGKSGYDVVTPNLSPHFARQLQANVWAPLDPAALPNIKNIDAGVMQQLVKVDPKGLHGVPWMWGTTGVIFNVEKIKAIMPDAPVDSWAMLFDPEIVAKFATCGVVMLDDGEQVLGSVLIYQGKDPNTATAEDIDAAAALITKLRPSIRHFHTSEYLNGLAAGDYCLALGFSGDARVASLRAAESKQAFKIEYRLPKEGALMYFDVLAVPADAPNADAGVKFLNFVMRPEIAAGAANETGFATANAEAMKMVDPALRDDKNLYPTSESISKLTVPRVFSPNELRIWHKAWRKAIGQE
jgi:putrescine transport system substrate-binding protein